MQGRTFDARPRVVAALSAVASWETWNEVRTRHDLDFVARRRAEHEATTRQLQTRIAQTEAALARQTEQAAATDRSWAGYVTTDAGMVSGWHHHGDYETSIYVVDGALRMESGPDGSVVFEAGPGEAKLWVNLGTEDGLGPGSIVTALEEAGAPANKVVRAPQGSLVRKVMAKTTGVSTGLVHDDLTGSK